MANFNDSRNNSNRRDQAPAEPKQFEEIVVNVDRVSRVVKGGRRFRFKALVAVGDGKNKIGVGVAKGADVQAAVAKATNVAKKHVISISIEKATISHESEVKFTGAHVLLKPAAPGTGIIAGGVVRTIIGLTGIHDIMTKSLGSTNKVNIAYATVKALESIVPKSEWLNVKKGKKKTGSIKPSEEVVIEAPVAIEKPKKTIVKKPATKKVLETK